MSSREILYRHLEVLTTIIFDAANRNITRKQYIIDNMQVAKLKAINETSFGVRSLKVLMTYSLNRVVMNVKEELDYMCGTVIAICIGGAIVSTLGYLLMWLTAKMFPVWRNNGQNRLWLQMCTADLLTIYTRLFQWLIFDGRIDGPDDLHVAETYFLQVTFSLLLCGALLTHSRLIHVFADRKRFVFKSTLFSWLVPVTFSLVANFTDIAYHQSLTEAHLPFKTPFGLVTLTPDVLLLLYGAAALVPCVVLSLCCVVVYTRVVYRVWRDSQSRRSVAASVSLAAVFLLTSGVQCAVSVTRHMFVSGSSDLWTYWSSAMVSFDVAVYSVLFLFGNKITRELWTEWFRLIISRYWN